VKREPRAARQGAARTLLVLIALVGAFAATPGAQAASTKSCSPIRNPYPGTRYAGEDLTRIRATGVSCATARRVVRGAHRKALGITPSLSGIRHLTWDGWSVTGDLRGDHDTYVAKRGSERVRWVF
jgi:hypothetical protein